VRNSPPARIFSPPQLKEACRHNQARFRDIPFLIFSYLGLPDSVLILKREVEFIKAKLKRKLISALTLNYDAQKSMFKVLAKSLG